MQKVSVVVDVQEKIFKFGQTKKYLSWKWPQANPNPNPNPNVQGKIFETCVEENNIIVEVTPTWSSTLIVFQGVKPKTNPRVKLRVRVSLGHLQIKYFFVYTSVKDFSLNVYDDTNLLHLVSGSERFSFSQELTPTLTLGLSLGLGLGLA